MAKNGWTKDIDEILKKFPVLMFILMSDVIERIHQILTSKCQINFNKKNCQPLSKMAKHGWTKDIDEILEKMTVLMFIFNCDVIERFHQILILKHKIHNHKQKTDELRL